MSEIILVCLGLLILITSLTIHSPFNPQIGSQTQISLTDNFLAYENPTLSKIQFIPVDAQQQPMWKTFTDRKGLFTIQYPSNWSPAAVPEPVGPIDIDFDYLSTGNSFAYVNIIASDSLFSSSQEAIDSLASSSASTDENYEVERAIECSKYILNGMPACSIIESFSLPEEGYRAALTAVAVDDTGKEYQFTYAASLDLFKHFLPVVEVMLKSFKVIGDIPSSSGAAGSLPGADITGKEFSLQDNTTGSLNTSLAPPTLITQSKAPQNNLTNAKSSLLTRSGISLENETTFENLAAVELNNKGAALSAVGSYEEAITYFDKALQIDPNFGIALVNKGLALDYLERLDEAIKLYDKALAINPNDNHALSNKGGAFLRLGSYEEAITYFDKVLQINPSNAYALGDKGLALDSLGSYNEAINYYDKSLAINANDDNILANKGAALGSLGRYDEAITYYDKALAINPNDATTLANKRIAIEALNAQSN